MSEARELSDRVVGPDAAAIRTFCEVLFGYAEGHVPVRLLAEKGAPSVAPSTPFELVCPGLADAIISHARSAARRGAATYVVPGTVPKPGKARSDDIGQLTTVLIDLDDGDIGAKRPFLVRHLGEPSLEVASGGVTSEGQQKLHLYWRLTESASGPDIATVCRLRAEIARKVGGDPSFASAHQPIRVAGSVYGKNGRRCLVRIVGRSHREVGLAELAEAVLTMPHLVTPGAPARAMPAKMPLQELRALRVRENGADGVTRFEALSRVVGSLIRQARTGELDLDEAWQRAREHNEKMIEPPWTDDRLRREFERLVALDVANHGASAPAVDDTGRRAVGAGSVDPSPLTDDALAELFTERHAADWRYCAGWARWLHWTGTSWSLDELGRAHHLARMICREAAGGVDGKLKRQVASAASAAAVERLARSDPRHAAGTADWDRDPWLLNTPGGIVELRSGEVRRHDRAAMMTKCAGASPGEGCLNWLTFLDKVSGGDRELQAYLARVAGYCLTGMTVEHTFFFVHGPGANGKSVLLRVFGEVLGGYATMAPLDTFLASGLDRHPTDLAGLHGARLVSVSETEEGRRWAETKLKGLTGGDRVKARFVRRDFFEYTPICKLIIAGNFRPEFRDTGRAMRRRLHLIPFEVTISDQERDLYLADTLLQERDGILGWMLAGCAEWQRIGLAPPSVVHRATEAYFAEEDRTGRWLAECCSTEPTASTPVGILYRSFRSWAEAVGEEPGSMKAFSQALDRRGFRRARSANRQFQGLRLVGRSSCRGDSV